MSDDVELERLLIGLIILDYVFSATIALELV